MSNASRKIRRMAEKLGFRAEYIRRLGWYIFFCRGGWKYSIYPFRLKTEAAIWFLTQMQDPPFRQEQYRRRKTWRKREWEFRNHERHLASKRTRQARYDAKRKAKWEESIARMKKLIEESERSLTTLEV